MGEENFMLEDNVPSSEERLAQAMPEYYQKVQDAKKDPIYTRFMGGISGIHSLEQLKYRIGEYNSFIEGAYNFAGHALHIIDIPLERLNGVRLSEYLITTDQGKSIIKFGFKS